MKKMISLLLAVLLAAGALCGCAPAAEHSGVKIVCTVFPLYDWMRELTAGSEDIELVLIADNGVDMHSYQPTTGDIVDISTCDMLVYVGGQSDEWVEEIVSRSGNDRMIKAPLLDALGDRAMCAASHEHDAEDGDHGHDHHHHDHDAKDEHIWLSAANAAVLCGELTEMLCGLDEDNAQLYRSNAEGYIARINELDERYCTAADNAGKAALLFADRFPFRYLARDYNIEYHAAFDGCEAETEASFETVVHLAAELDSQDLDCVLIIEGSEDRLARTIIESSNRSDREILVLDSMQSVSREDIDGGAAWLGIMENNLRVLEQALDCRDTYITAAP